MVIKRRCLLIVIVSAILVSALTFSGCTQQGSEISDDYLLFERAEAGDEYLHISKSGDVQNTIFSGSKIYKYTSGTLSEGEMKELSEFIEKSGFFRLRGAYLHHYDYFRISVYREGKVKTVYEDYRGEVPVPFEEVVRYLGEKVELKLQDETRYGTFIKAEKEKGFSSENVLSEEDLKEHPFLDQAINNLSWFVYIGSLDDTELENFITPGKNSFYVTFEDEQFRIGIYEWQK